MATAESLAREFKAVNRIPLSAQVAQQLRRAIMGGELAPGDQLPTEHDLVQNFGVSRASVREALGALRAEGLLVGTGAPARAVVASDLDRPAHEALANLMRLRGVKLDDLVELRCLLETAALADAARDPNPERLAEAAEALAQMQEDDLSIEEFDGADVRFHTALVRASKNEAMHLVMLALRDPVEQHLLDALRAESDPDEVLRRLTDQHADILAAVEEGDGTRAATLVERHLRGYYNIAGPTD